MGMSIPYELTGRTSQKARTRAAMVAAAALAAGEDPTSGRWAKPGGNVISNLLTFRIEEGTRSFIYSSMFIDPPDGRIPAVVAPPDRRSLPG